MKIQIKAKHIRAGIKAHDRQYPIALALKEKLHKKVVVNEFNCKIYKSKRDVFDNYSYPFPVIYLLPDKARKFIKDFDKGRPVKPFSFVLK